MGLPKTASSLVPHPAAVTKVPSTGVELPNVESSTSPFFRSNDPSNLMRAMSFSPLGLFQSSCTVKEAALSTYGEMASIRNSSLTLFSHFTAKL